VIGTKFNAVNDQGPRAKRKKGGTTLSMPTDGSVSRFLPNDNPPGEWKVSKPFEPYFPPEGEVRKP